VKGSKNAVRIQNIQNSSEITFYAPKVTWGSKKPTPSKIMTKKKKKHIFKIKKFSLARIISGMHSNPFIHALSLSEFFNYTPFL